LNLQSIETLEGVSSCGQNYARFRSGRNPQKTASGEQGLFNFRGALEDNASTFWYKDPLVRLLNSFLTCANLSDAGIQAPVSSSVVPLLSLRCNKRNAFITIEIEQNEDLSILKKMIKKDKSIELQGCVLEVRATSFSRCPF